MNEVEIFRPKSNLIWAGISYFLVLIFVIQSFFYPAKIENTLINALVAIFSSLASYIMWVRPKLVLHRDFLRVINPFITKSIRYQDIERLDTKWCLQITHQAGTTGVWVAPANSRRAARGRLGMRIKGIVEPENRTISDSELAAQLIKTRLDSH
jgi:hypothetical protein